MAALVVGAAWVSSQTGCTTSSQRRATATAEPNTPVPTTPTPLNSNTATVTFTRTVTNTRTITETPTETATQTPPQSPTPANTPQVTGTPITITVDCWSATNFCVICSALNYSCSSLSGWTPSCAFTDPCPGGTSARQIAAIILGESCTALTTFATDVNGTALGSTANAPVQCGCNACDSWTHVSAYYSGGFPGWVTAGTNTFSFTSITGGQMCISYVQLTVACQ